MKKLLAIIGILLVIFVGMYIYKNKQNQSNVNVSEVKEIEDYISKIYMWKEITEEALPKFDDINNAPELWLWEVVKKNLEEFELEYNQIQEKAIEIFGDNFKKQFPKEGSEYIFFDENIQKYVTTGIGLDTLDDVFLIKEIKKNKNKYEVEIVEYLQDYENAMGIDEGEIYDIYIRNLQREMIATIKSDESETKIIDVVKENINNFTSKKIQLVRNSSGEIFVEKVE